MRPVVAPEAMRRLDAAAPEPMQALIARAGWLVADRARGLLGGCYGRSIAVLCGPGNNGADGRVAASWLGRWGAAVTVVEAPSSTPLPAGVDLVIDAVFGTGFRGRYEAPPSPPAALVLAVDIPSGVDGATGEVRGSPLAADHTLTFAAAKPGSLLMPGAVLGGRLEVVDVGVPVADDAVDGRWIEDADLDRWPRRAPGDHKWNWSVWVIGGSGTMSGALGLAVAASQRAGAGFVRASTPGQATPSTIPAEAVAFGLPAEAWDEPVVLGGRRFGALVVGPGLAVDAANAAAVRSIVTGWPGALVLDAGALDPLAGHLDLLADRSMPAVLTPHDGELRRLVPEIHEDRVGALRGLAARLGAVVLSKGPTTLVAGPSGDVAYVTGGAICGHDARLATAGSGDVLAGTIGAGLAGGLGPWEAAAYGAHLHALAAARGRPVGLVAGDLPPLVADVLSGLRGAPAAPSS